MSFAAFDQVYNTSRNPETVSISVSVWYHGLKLTHTQKNNHKNSQSRITQEDPRELLWVTKTHSTLQPLVTNKLDNVQTTNTQETVGAFLCSLRCVFALVLPWIGILWACLYWKHFSTRNVALTLSASKFITKCHSLWWENGFTCDCNQRGVRKTKKRIFPFRFRSLSFLCVLEDLMCEVDWVCCYGGIAVCAKCRHHNNCVRVRVHIIPYVPQRVEYVLCVLICVRGSCLASLVSVT